MTNEILPADYDFEFQLDAAKGLAITGWEYECEGKGKEWGAAVLAELVRLLASKSPEGAAAIVTLIPAFVAEARQVVGPPAGAH